MQVRIEFTYKTPKGIRTTFRSEEMQAEDAISMVEDLERTGRSRDIRLIDHKEHTWSLKELKEFLKGIETEPHNIVVYFDGGFDLEAKRSGLGCVIYYDQNGKSYRIRKNALVEELTSNNEAEYAALHLALKELALLDVHHLPVKLTGDSQVVINQLNGEWPVMEETLSEWADRIELTLKKLGLEPEYQLVSRKDNQEADRLASQALKEVEISSTSEVKP
ncbi:reverse transcriptase-like protein [Pseudalkalibacillus sp. SCS-8]|uniref:reverse transcriptase-like protein n=1 Tax=Pseudalkalibacillus nanhaiensis TaxID=3115291 RepID=UPI0032DA9EEA